MDASQERVFHYHASANAIGGVISKPYQVIITSDANSALANAGGTSGSKTVTVHHDHLVHVDRAYTNTSGGSEDQHWATLSSSVLENVNLIEVLTADKIVGQISSKHPKASGAATLSFVGSQFVNVRVNGHLLEFVLDLHPFPGGAGYKGAAHPATGKVSSFHHPEVRKLAAEHARHATKQKHSPDWVKKRYAWLADDKQINEKGTLTCSLVKEIKGWDPEYTFGHILYVPGFGNLFFGEISFDSQSYHLTMVRAEMGCAAEGTVSMSTAVTNGKPYPP